MRVTIDIRPLLEPRRSGIPTFTAELVAALCRRGAHRYTLFANAWNAALPSDIPPASDAVRRRVTRYPNKLLNASVALFGRPRIETLAGDTDAVYLPNLNFAATAKPSVVTVHDLSFERYPRFFSAKQRLWHALVRPRRLLERAAAITAVSAHTKADLIETYGIPEERIHVVHPGVNARFAPQSAESVAGIRKKYDLPERFFLSLGTLEPRKNVEAAIAAFDHVPGDAAIVIAGGKGWLYDRIFRRAAESPKRDRIRFIGYVDDADKPAMYAAAAALVYPSFYEGFGMQPLEAMACGTPVVAGQTASLGEVVGDAGLLVNPERVEEIADAMQAVLDEPALAAALRERGLERAKRFSWDESAEKMEKIFSSLG